MSFSMAERMMQPARQTRAMAGIWSAQPNSRGGGVIIAKALRVAEDLAGDQRLFEVIEREALSPAAGPGRKVPARRAFLKPGGDVARHHGGLDHRDRRGEVQGLDRGPAAGALLACRVDDQVEKRAAGDWSEAAATLAEISTR
jgi:hypothetical protein